MSVRVHLGGGNYADLEPELYEVDRSLLEDCERADCGCVAFADGTGEPCPDHHPDRRAEVGGGA